MGVPWQDTAYVGGLIGMKTVLNEFVAYAQFAGDLKSERSPSRPAAPSIAAYALLGFANFSLASASRSAASAASPPSAAATSPASACARCSPATSPHFMSATPRRDAAVSLALLARLDEAAAAVRARTPLRPAIGVVLGSGLGAFADALEDAVAVPSREIPHFPASTVVGHGGALVVGRSRGVPVAVMKGRVHFYEGYSLDAGRLPGPGARPPRRRRRSWSRTRPAPSTPPSPPAT